MDTNRTKQGAVRIVDLRHIIKEFRTNQIKNKKGGENWTRLEHHELEDESEVICLNIKE